MSCPEDDRSRGIERQRLEMAAEELEKQNVPFDVIPEGIYPGMLYTTPLDLVNNGVTKYSQQRILFFVRHKVISAHHLAGKVVFDATQVKQLLAYEAAASQAANPTRRPGPRKEGARTRRPRSQRTS